jgi:hypothetical protein
MVRLLETGIVTFCAGFPSLHDALWSAKASRMRIGRASAEEL